MKKHLYTSIVQLTNNPIYTMALKRFATSKLSGLLTNSFSKTFKIDEQEMEGTSSDYPSLHDFFVRNLKEGSRPLHEEVDSIVSPVDGKLSQLGVIDSENFFHVKEKDYSLATMLGLTNTTKRYEGGTYMLFYLSPRDYHRIHSPIKGHVVKRWAIGKYSEPVNQWGLLFGNSPLANNYRLITELEYNNKRMAVVKIGALNVNSVQTTHLNSSVERGEEIAYFTFGSSVILLFEKDMVTPSFDMNHENVPIKQGEKIASLN
ncbi:phosphatidylserine decarboxylase [Evansella sp. AB-P1]|uniref:phosphatidylserine decarboxylase n=1 Tax=Evansella sp. AB-P1 TaxID=3037653 RepID=UPI00241D822D|nr:phosphatidylserine decarboxylase [Evansella sp. AB-P1]MDG5786501.1 phosphatidylserine decarboxylase [Evansella sp. AB-P1]